jgi:DNA-directed RNA polymerase specialized sigma24 family protein
MLNQEDSRESTQTPLEVRLADRVQEIRALALQSSQRRQLLNRLVNEILQSGKLGHPQQSAWPPSLYEDLYNEALQKTLLIICQTIDQYNPDHPVMAWVNFRLHHQFIEVVKDYQKQGITQMPKTGNHFPIRLPSLEDLPVSAPSTDADLQIRQFLQQDPEGLLKKQRLRERPEITFHALAIAKVVEGKSWTEMAASMGVPAQTLCSFFNRQLKSLIPYFKRYLEA